VRKLTIENVQKIFEENGFQLLEDVYKGTKSKLKFKCSCGNISYTTVDNVRRGRKCAKCGFNRQIEKQKLDSSVVQKYVTDHGCQVTTPYINYHSKMGFKCFCGNNFSTSFSHFKRGVRCATCAIKRSADAKRLNPSYVKEQFENEGFQLLDDFTESGTRMRCICPRGHELSMDWEHFKLGNRCIQCHMDDHRGANHPNWNPELTQEDRENKRRIDGIDEWRLAVFHRDDFTCQKCKCRGGKLHAHHIRNYANNKDLRVVVNNGATLCEDCHRGFHGRYGHKNTNEEQLNEYLN
jgi:hypothetical protein